MCPLNQIKVSIIIIIKSHTRIDSNPNSAKKRKEMYAAKWEHYHNEDFYMRTIFRGVS